MPFGVQMGNWGLLGNQGNQLQLATSLGSRDWAYSEGWAYSVRGSRDWAYSVQKWNASPDIRMSVLLPISSCYRHSARPLAGLARDLEHLRLHLLILQSTTLLNTLLLISNGWMTLSRPSGYFFRFTFTTLLCHCSMSSSCMTLRLARISNSLGFPCDTASRAASREAAGRI
jgi:hypothetical protein